MNERAPASAVAVSRVFEGSLLLLVSVGFATVALAGRIDALSTTIFATALVVRLLAIFGVIRVRCPRWAVSALALLYSSYFGFVIFSDGGFSLQKFIPATMGMLFFFTALEMVIAKKGRDYFYLGLLAFLHMLVASMFAGSVMYLGMLVLFLVVAILTYTSWEITRGCASGAPIAVDFGGLKTRRMGRRLSMLSVLLGVGVLVLSIGLFVILPRAPGFASFRGLAGDFRLGFADEIDLGAVGGTLALDNSPVMHVRPLNESSLDNLRWRGLGLSHFNGMRWSNPSQARWAVEPGSDIAALAGERRRAPKGRTIDYSVMMQPLRVKAIFLAGLTDTIDMPRGSFRKLEVDDTDSLLVDSEDMQPLRYRAQGWVSDRDSFEPAWVVSSSLPNFVTSICSYRKSTRGCRCWPSGSRGSPAAA